MPTLKYFDQHGLEIPPAPTPTASASLQACVTTDARGVTHLSETQLAVFVVVTTVDNASIVLWADGELAGWGGADFLWILTDLTHSVSVTRTHAPSSICSSLVLTTSSPAGTVLQLQVGVQASVLGGGNLLAGASMVVSEAQKVTYVPPAPP